MNKSFSRTIAPVLLTLAVACGAADPSDSNDEVESPADPPDETTSVTQSADLPHDSMATAPVVRGNGHVSIVAPLAVAPAAVAPPAVAPPAVAPPAVTPPAEPSKVEPPPLLLRATAA